MQVPSSLLPPASLCWCPQGRNVQAGAPWGCRTPPRPRAPEAGAPGTGEGEGDARWPGSQQPARGLPGLPANCPVKRARGVGTECAASGSIGRSCHGRHLAYHCRGISAAHNTTCLAGTASTVSIEEQRGRDRDCCGTRLPGYQGSAFQEVRWPFHQEVRSLPLVGGSPGEGPGSDGRSAGLFPPQDQAAGGRGVGGSASPG